MKSAGKQFRLALQHEAPLQVVGALNAYCALLAKQARFQALYLSGSGLAMSSFAYPDIGLISCADILDAARSLAQHTDLPILVDIDTGGENLLVTENLVKDLSCAGLAGIHIEDQVSNAKRCGHDENKVLVSTQDMQARIRAAISGKQDADFVVMARTDAIAVEGMQAGISRAQAYVAAGADMIFVEAVTSIQEIKAFRSALSVPILINLTEFGKTPLFSLSALKAAQVDMVLYPLSAARAMHAAATKVYTSIRQKGSQKSCLSVMEDRKATYKNLQRDFMIERAQSFINENKVNKQEDLSDESK